MHSEHLQNVRPSWVAFGWFIGFAMTGLLLFALIAVGILDAVPAEDDATFWTLVALGFGFAGGGFFVGARTAAAPILHGVGMGLFSLLVWFVVNLFLGEPTDQTAWSALDGESLAGLLLLQIAAAIAGAWLGRRWTHRL